MADIWVFFTFLGQPEFWGIVGLILSFIYIVVRHYGKDEFREVYKRALLFLFISILVSLSVTQGLKYTFDSKRPCMVCSPQDIECNEYCLSTPSFPSGHATITFAGFTSLFMIIRKRKKFIPIFIIPALTAISRVVLGVHFWQDILVGSAIGMILPFIIHEIRKEWWDF